MELSQLTAISPIDGRYKDKTDSLRKIFSEYGLMQKRIEVEVEWLKALCESKKIKELPTLTFNATQHLNKIVNQFSIDDAKRIKEIELTTNHDVKAVEYFVKEKVSDNFELKQIDEFIHFCCTSEDINNIAYGLMIKQAKYIVLEQIRHIQTQLERMGNVYRLVSMLSRTHGQPASPTTLGKEMNVFAYRLSRQEKQIEDIQILGKINGAVGNFNAHVVAYPNVDWECFAADFVEKYLQLTYNPVTTQIEPHDYMAELFSAITRANTILIDLCRDIWGYISNGYFLQKINKEETGSSTMPHKVNPIDFENAEGNLGIANAIFTHLSLTLPISRWQRDLTDSTILRNVGVGFAHSIIAYESIKKGFTKLMYNIDALNEDLGSNWKVLAEPIQTVMRKHGLEKPYEQLKDFIRGYNVDQSMWQEFIQRLNIPDEDKQRLLNLTPKNYIGKASTLSILHYK